MNNIKLNKIEKEKLDLIESKKDIIINLLNKIALLEFSVNYNLSEYKRIVDINNLENNKQYKLLKNRLENILDFFIKDTVFSYTITSFGTLSVLYPTNIEISDEVQCLQAVLKYRHNINLPYSYVMGKSVRKELRNSVLNELKNNF